jgi:sigma-B regulation protein RsbU (phosphoserine phosphatase)
MRNAWATPKESALNSGRECLPGCTARLRVRPSKIMLPRGWDRRTTVFLAFALLFVISTNLAPAQVVNLQDGHVLMTELTGPWKFHTGDDPLWSDQRFDDSAWPMLDSDKTGLPSGELSGSFVWYRTQITFRGSGLALEMPSIRGVPYEVFVNGERIGGFGRLPPKPYLEGGPGQIFAIPAKATGKDGRLVVAVRAWYSDSSQALLFPPHIPAQMEQVRWTFPMIGDSAFLWKLKSLESHDNFWRAGVRSLQVPLELLGAFAGFLLFALSRFEREYLWYGTLQLNSAAYDALVVYIGGAAFPSTATHVIFLLGNGLFTFFLLLFVFDFLAVRKNWMYRVAMTSAVIKLVVCPLLVMQGTAATGRAIHDIAEIVCEFCLVSILMAGVRRRNQDAQLLVIPVSLEALSSVAYISIDWAGRLGVRHVDTIASFVKFTVQWPFPFSFFDAAQVFFAFSMMVLLIFRFVRVRSVNREFASELEAARTVQQVLIPEQIPAIPGLALECIYKPAGQVGGDFFQVLPTTNNGALIVIGDVSGKGMPAAMAVSLLVGTVRTLAHYAQSPAEILNAMNQRMLARSKDGFTTCLILRIDPGGAATVANAGHLAPYVNAQELSVDHSLPLGISAEAVYSESTFRLDAGQELTLLTDGIAEARSKSGELFGFERTASISILSAQHIAATAAAFGQQDDITVLKVRRCPVPELAGALLAAEPSTSAA